MDVLLTAHYVHESYYTLLLLCNLLVGGVGMWLSITVTTCNWIASKFPVPK